MDQLSPIYRIEFFLDAIVNGSQHDLEPIYRVEFFLAKIAGEAVEIPAPLSRMEMFLAQLCGETVTLPEPQSRTEQYLAAICGADVEIPPFPIYRIEFWLDQWAQGGAGETLTVTGVSPLALANAIAHSIVSLTQYGLCEQRNLPKGYTQVEYIEADGSTGYVDTGIVLNTVDLEIEVDYQFTASPGAASPSMVWGYMGGQNNLPRWGFGAYGGKWLGSINQTSSVGSFDTNRHTAVLRAFMDGENPMWDGTFDGTELYAAASLPNLSTFTGNTLPVMLFARNNNGTAGNFAPAKIYAFKVRKAGVLVSNLIPCKTASAVGFYDTVTGTFLAGTGTLTAGADATPSPSAPILCNNGEIKARRQSGLPLGYQRVQWIKSAGAIVITGFKTKSTQEITTVFYRERSGASYLYASDSATSGTTNTTAYLTSGGGNWRWDGKSVSISISSGIEITSVQKNDGVWLNGTRYGTYTDAGDFVSTNDLRLSSSENTTVRIKSQTIREGDTVTLDLVAVQRLSDSAYGFYDKVSGEFYTNAEATITAGDPIDDPVEIYADGTPEVLTISYNEFDPSTMGAPTNVSLANADSTGVVVNPSSRSLIFPCEPNTPYTVSFKSAPTGGTIFRVATVAERVTSQNSPVAAIAYDLDIANFAPKTINTGSDAALMYIQFSAAYIEEIIDILVIQKGSDIIQPQTIANVPNLFATLDGTARDEVDVVSGIVTRRTEPVYENGEIVIKPLAEPVTEQTTPQHLSTGAGTNVVSVSAAVDGIVLAVVYKGTAA